MGNYKNITKQNCCFYSIFTVIFFVGIWLRTEYLSRHLEYDEIWTLTQYVTEPISLIFSDLTTPNNHPLSTLLVKNFTLLFGDGIIIQRLPAFISGIILLIIITHLAYVTTKSKFCALLTLTFNSLNGGLIYYSQTARGYELQVLLIIVFIYLLIMREKHEQKKIPLVVVFSLTGIALMLTLSTSIIFIFGITLIHFSYLVVHYYKKEKILFKAVKKILAQENIILGYLLIGGFSIVWFTFNYQQYKQGQNYGTSIESTKQFLSFGYKTLFYIVPMPILFLSIIPIFFKRYAKFALAYFLLVVFTLASALFFKAGPPRVYLPLIPIICFAGSYGAYLLLESFKNKISLILKTVFILVSFLYLFLQIPYEHKNWFAIDWQKIYNFLSRSLPYNYYIYLPATAGYPAGYHNNYGVIENVKRTPAKNGFVVVLQEGISSKPKEVTFTGINPISYDAEEILISQENPFKTIEFSESNCSAILLSIIPVDQTDTIENATFMTIFPDPRLKYNIRQNIAIVINVWLNLKDRPSTILLKKNSMSKDEMVQLEKQSNGHIRFFNIKEASEQSYDEFRNNVEILLLAPDFKGKKYADKSLKAF